MNVRSVLWVGVALTVVSSAGCAHRRCDTWSDAACKPTGEPAVAATVRIYALGDAGKSTDERAQALGLLGKVMASEAGESDRVLALLGNNVYERGVLSSDADLASAETFYTSLFGLTPWKTVAIVPGNYDHGAFRHGGFDEKAITAEAAWFRRLRADVLFPPAADPRTESPWTTLRLPGHEQCLSLHTTDSQGFRENFLALPAQRTDSAWNLALAHHPTRTAANHMGDRYRDDYASYDKSLEQMDLLLSAHENVLFADLEPKGDKRPGPPNIVSGSFARAQRIKAPEFTSCAAEQPGFVRLSITGDKLVADFFAFKPGELPSPHPYCTQTIEKPGASAKCVVGQATSTVSSN